MTTTRGVGRLAAVILASVLACAASSASAAGLLVADGGFGGVLEIEEHDVKVTINNGVAVTEVTQVFRNTENRIVEALYTFPVPKGASVANFSMWINGTEMVGEVLEKERARQIYESYKQTRRDPGLLEQVNYKQFEMRIFPIPAGAEQRVKITYYQELDFDHDWATYVYPLATTTRSSVDQKVHGKFAFSLEVLSEVPVVEMKSTSHAEEFIVAEHSSNYLQASLETSGGALDRDIVLAYHIARPRTGFDVITSKQSGEDGYFLMTLTTGQELAEHNQGMDFVFLLDVSGSMATDGKLGLSRNSLGAFVSSLGDKDRFEVMTFNVVLEGLFSELRSSDQANQAEAQAFLESQRAVGGTNLRPAVEAAYRYRDADRTLNVVILSDGMTEPREQQQLLELIGQRPSGVRVFCIGVGNEVNRPLLQQLAQQAGGLAAFLSQGDDFERQAEAFRRKLVRPAAENLQVKFAGGEVHDVEPQVLPNLYHGAPLRIYGRYKTAGPMTITLVGEVLGGPFEQSVSIELPAEDPSNPQIERMWAAHRVDRLMGEVRQRGETPELKQEIVRLCEGYSITSEYASFIVLENDAEYKRWQIERRNVTRVARDDAARRQLRQKLDAIRNQSQAQVGPKQPAGKETTAQSTPDVPATPAAQPVPNSQPAPVTQPDADQFAQAPRPQSVPQPQRPRSRDLNLDQFVPSAPGGGGAIDPFTALAAAGLVGASAWASRRRRS